MSPKVCAHRFASALVLAFAANAALAAPPGSITFADMAHQRAVDALESAPTLKASPEMLLVRFKEGTPEAAKDALRQVIGGLKVRDFSAVPGLEQVHTTLGAELAVRVLNQLPQVQYAELDHVVRPTATPNDTYFSLQYGLLNTGQSVNGTTGTPGADIRATQAWDVTTGDPNFVIAVIDTGMQLNHPDLAANLYTNPGEVPGNGQDDDGNGYVDDVNGWNFYNANNDPSDAGGHGTHTAGTVGAVGNNGTGVTGVNWQCRLMPLKFLGPNGGYTSDAVLAVEYCTTMGVKVSNNSWGGGGYSQALYDAISASRSVGHVFVAAAGNGGFDQIGDNNDSTPHYPSNYNLDNIIAVAATDSRDARASFSNYGANSVDLGAPGVNIASTYINSNYVYNSGTSMACPHVAGVAALVYAANPGWSYQQVRSRILDTVRPVSSMNGITTTGGVLDAAAAIGGGGEPINTPPSVSISSPASGANFTVGSSISFSGSSTDTQDGNLSSGLIWTSSLQGQIGTGASFSRSDLVLGTHTITATSTDSGDLSDSASVQITVGEAVNTPPSVSISSPGSGASFSVGASITFSGSASDNQDGNLSSGLVWTSSLQGQIGTGASFSRSDLVAGTHTITATSTDSGDLSGSSSVQITVSDPSSTPPAPPSGVSASDLRNGSARITWSDNSNNEQSFQIQRERRQGRNYTDTTIVGSVGANTTTFTDSPGSGRFRYRVRAVNSAGASAWSNWAETRVR